MYRVSVKSEKSRKWGVLKNIREKSVNLANTRDREISGEMLVFACSIS